MFNVNYLTPFQIAMNHYDLDLTISHILSQLSKRTILVPDKSYYLKSQHISFSLSSYESSDTLSIALENFLSKYNFSYVLAADRNRNTWYDFRLQNLKSQTFKIQVKRQKVEDNKTFLQQILISALQRYRLDLKEIYGIIAVDSHSNRRILNITHFWNSLLISNGLVDLSFFDEFYIFTFDTPNLQDNPEVTKQIHDDVIDLFQLYCIKTFSAQNNKPQNKGIIYNWKYSPTDNQFMTRITDTSERIEGELKHRFMFIPTHLNFFENIRPYYGYTFLISDSEQFTPTSYLEIESLNCFGTGNISSYICTGQQDRNSYYGLTTLEVFNSNSQFTSEVIVGDYERAKAFANINVILSFEQYLKEDYPNKGDTNVFGTSTNNTETTNGESTSASTTETETEEDSISEEAEAETETNDNFFSEESEATEE